MNRKAATMRATSKALTPASRNASGHDRWAASKLASTTALGTATAARPHLTRGMRINKAAAIALPGQRSAMPPGALPGARVSQMDRQADAKSAAATRISFHGDLESRASAAAA